VRAKSNQAVVIADGYHRMCAVYSFDEDALIPWSENTESEELKRRHK